MNLTPLSPLAKAKANHPTAQTESALAFVVRMLSQSDHDVLHRTWWYNPTFRYELRALLAREQRTADLFRYPDDGVASAAVESQWPDGAA